MGVPVTYEWWNNQTILTQSVKKKRKITKKYRNNRCVCSVERILTNWRMNSMRDLIRIFSNSNASWHTWAEHRRAEDGRRGTDRVEGKTWKSWDWPNFIFKNNCETAIQKNIKLALQNSNFKKPKNPFGFYGFKPWVFFAPILGTEASCGRSAPSTRPHGSPPSPEKKRRNRNGGGLRLLRSISAPSCRWPGSELGPKKTLTFHHHVPLPPLLHVGHFWRPQPWPVAWSDFPHTAPRASSVGQVRTSDMVGFSDKFGRFHNPAKSSYTRVFMGQFSIEWGR